MSGSSTLPTKKILIAEDEPFLAKIYETRMTQSGLDVCIAKNGEELFHILESFAPDLILLDLLMPRKDGFQVLSELSQNPQWKCIPVIVTSNLGEATDKDKVRELGAVDYIVKSEVSILDIIERIKQFLSQQPVPSQPTPSQSAA